MTKDTLNTIEAVQTIVDTMQQLEKDYFEIQKQMDLFNERQNDLLHALELDLTKADREAVVKALYNLRIERRDLKDQFILLAEAKDFVGSNYKFLNEGIQVAKKMKQIEEKTSQRKYYVRHCEEMSEVIDMKKYDKLGAYNK